MWGAILSFLSLFGMLTCNYIKCIILDYCRVTRAEDGMVFRIITAKVDALFLRSSLMLGFTSMGRNYVLKDSQNSQIWIWSIIVEYVSVVLHSLQYEY